MAAGFRSGFGVAFGIIFGLVVAGILVFVGCPMLVCGGLGVIGIAASEAERAQREAAQPTPAIEAQEQGDRAFATNHSTDTTAAQAAKQKPILDIAKPPGTAKGKKLAASAKETLKYLSAVDGEERVALVDGLEAVKVRWVGDVARRVAQKDGQYDLIARCNGARVRCLFDKRPAAAIAGLKRDRRIIVYGTVIGLEDVPKMGPTLQLTVEKVKTLKPTTTAPDKR